MESFPTDFAAVVNSIAYEVHLWTVAQSKGRGDEADARLEKAEELHGQLVGQAVLGDDPCQQVYDMAVCSAAVTLCQAFGMDGLEERLEEFEHAIEPQPEEVSLTLWKHTQDLFWASAKMACAEASGDDELVRAQQRAFSDHVRYISGLEKVSEGHDCPAGEGREAQTLVLFKKMKGIPAAGSETVKTVYHCTTKAACESIVEGGFRFPTEGDAHAKGLKLGAAVYFGCNAEYCKHEALNTLAGEDQRDRARVAQTLGVVEARVKLCQPLSLGHYGIDRFGLSEEEFEVFTEGLTKEHVNFFGYDTITINEGRFEAEVAVYDACSILHLSVADL